LCASFAEKSEFFRKEGDSNSLKGLVFDFFSEDPNEILADFIISVYFNFNPCSSMLEIYKTSAKGNIGLA
jgi:hypothetical protein